MIWQKLNWSNLKVPLEVSDGDIFIGCNLSQFSPGTDILAGKKNLGFIDCNNVNVKMATGWKADHCNTSVNQYSTQPGDAGDELEFERNIDKTEVNSFLESERALVFKNWYEKNELKNKMVQQKYAGEINAAVGSIVVPIGIRKHTLPSHSHYVDPAATGANDGTSWGDAWITIQSAFDNVAAGETVYCRGTETLSATIDIDTTAGTSSNWISFIGMNASGVEDGTQYTLDGDSTAINCLKTTGVMDGYHMYNIRCINSTGSALTSDATIKSHWLFYNCSFDSAGANGCDTWHKWRSTSIIKCSFNDNFAIGSKFGHTETHHVLCIAIGNGNTGFYSPHSLTNCISHNNTLYGAFMSIYSGMHASIMDGNGSNGIYCGNTNGVLIASTRITHNALLGIQTGTGSVYSQNNGFYNNTSGEKSANVTAIDDLTLTADGYADRGADDFTLATTGEGVGVDIEAGPVGSGHNGFFTQGIAPEYSVGDGICSYVNGGLVG